MFEGQENVQFADRSDSWLPKGAKVSNSAAWGDLDGDGDLDLVTNNLNEAASLYINTGKKKGNFLTVQLQGTGKNTQGVGAQVTAYAQGKAYYRELFPNRGFQSSSEPKVFFGLGDLEKIDSLTIRWAEGDVQRLGEQKTNQHLKVAFAPQSKEEKKSANREAQLFEKVEGRLGIAFDHKEDNYSHFNREKLIPYSVADRGPALVEADLNGDGQKDLLFGGSKYFPPQLFVQSDSSYYAAEVPDAMASDSIQEWVSLVAEDFDKNGKVDIIAGTGGADFFGKAPALQDAYYSLKDTTYTRAELAEYFSNTAVLLSLDVDDDGDKDLWVGNQTATGKFGLPTESYLLLNTNGRFEIAQRFTYDGMPTAALYLGQDRNSRHGILVVGEWMSPKKYRWDGSQLKEEEINGPKGLWQSVAALDYDQDGDLDYLLGNWGSNTKFKASKKEPLKLFTADFDENGQTEAITAVAKEGGYYPIAGLDDLGSQMVFLRKKFTSYSAFAGKPMREILGKEALKKATVWEVEELRSGVLQNNNGQFEFVPFAWPMQLSPIMDILVKDFDGDGTQEALMGGNYFGLKPYQGRFDSFPGALWSSPGDFTLGAALGLDWQQKSLRHLRVISHNKQDYLLVVFNDAPAEVYKVN